MRKRHVPKRPTRTELKANERRLVEFNRGYRDCRAGRDPQPTSKDYNEGYAHAQNMGELKQFRRPQSEPDRPIFLTHRHP